MKTRIRVRRGDVKVDVSYDGEEAFLLERIPELVSELIRRAAGDPVPGQPAVPGEIPAATEPAPPALVGTPEPLAISLVGEVRDYWSGLPVPGATVATIGLPTVLTAVSDESGRFVMLGDPPSEPFYVIVDDAAGYVDTTVGIEYSEAPIRVRASAVAAADLRRQESVLGVDLDEQLGTVFCDLLAADGAPLEMVPATDLSLTSQGNSVGEGPVFFGASGDVELQSTLVVSRAFGGRARAAFFNVPLGSARIRATVFDAALGGTFVGQEISLVVRPGVTVAALRLPK